MRESALDKKGEGFTALDVSGRTILADTFAIVTGRSKIQTRAIADAVKNAVEREGYAVSRVEGYGEGSWILIDIGDVIVHVFTPEQRTFYKKFGTLVGFRHPSTTPSRRVGVTREA